MEYDDYDRLIQLCDSLANASGFCLMEKRMLDVRLRYGIDEYALRKWRTTFDIKTVSSAWDVRCTACCPGLSKTRLASRYADSDRRLLALEPGEWRIMMSGKLILVSSIVLLALAASTAPAPSARSRATTTSRACGARSHPTTFHG